MRLLSQVLKEFALKEAVAGINRAMDLLGNEIVGQEAKINCLKEEIVTLKAEVGALKAAARPVPTPRQASLNGEELRPQARHHQLHREYGKHPPEGDRASPPTGGGR